MVNTPSKMLNEALGKTLPSILLVSFVARIIASGNIIKGFDPFRREFA
jgi:hypothetical protein